ncbi:DUF6894 family protein [Wenxinia marina]|uniref:DUF6894 domain-containing protein n=1 Tax=Wenxinia marina DSM 24838 TaxID=1123501 RepID=A0A0D0PHG5_9RHOB|nr:hypothetical protein [Wenxinia marina]KIQ70791.1 hypothetical protein Wenmar_00165 [Wenxinia marina DSM 24838]GGL57265.1 hypothetical protein GCM10011392_09670 [Wenxinia marina]
MPTYYFDTRDGDRTTRDETGQDLPHRKSARDTAIEALPEIARDALPDGDEWQVHIRVREDGGTAFLDVSLTLRERWLD